MDLRRVLADTVLYRTPDGRVIFRPWGKRGKTYLVDASAERRLTNFLGIWTALMLPAVIVSVTWLGTITLMGVLVGSTLGAYVGFWVFSKKLPETEPPGPASADHGRMLRRENSRAWGQGTLTVMVVVAALMTLGGLAILLLGDVLSGLLSSSFFGACTGVFAWRLRQLRGS